MPKQLPKTIEGLTELIKKLVIRIEELETENNKLKKENEKLNLKDKKKQLNKEFNPKANTKKKNKERKKRERGYGRKQSEEPDEEVYHAYSKCPECDVNISGMAVAYTREVIDIPIIKPKIIWHWILKRRCWKCRKVWTPKVDFKNITLGKARFGHNAMSLISTLKERFRMPIEEIQSFLLTWCNLKISTGGIISILNRVADKGEPGYKQLKKELKKSKVVHADETGWREKGQNGYIWGFNTKQIRYLVYKKSRSKKVVDEVLGENFEGILECDFYGAYNNYGEYRQRCWAHLSWDLEDLTKLFPDKQVKDFCHKLKQLYKEGLKIQKSNLTLNQRHEYRRELENKILELAIGYTSKDQKNNPLHTIAKRIDRHTDELFVFVLDPEIEPTNNSAERALRHTVISRKISGGTRSQQGSQTKSILASLYGTWRLRELNPFLECKKLLAAPDYSF
jgi:transposase